MHSYIHISLSFSLYTIYILYIIYLQYMHMGYKPHATCVAPLCAQAQLLPVPPIKNGDVMGFSADL